MNDYILGVEIGGTKLQLAIGDLNGKLLYVQQGRVDLKSGVDGILQWLKSNVSAVIAKAADFGGDICGIGIGFGGPIETATGKVLISVQVKGWDQFKIKEWFSKNFKVPVIVANDSNAACWGEYNLGCGRGTKHFCYMNIGSGLGGGLVVNGKLHDGQGYGAGEIGQTYVPDWTSGSAGTPIRIELLCSGWAIEQRLNQTGYIPGNSKILSLSANGKITCAMLGQAAISGDNFAIGEINRVADSVSLALSNILSLFNPECIAIGGGVSNLGDVLIQPIREKTGKYIFISSEGRYRIEKCRLGDSIVLVGAVLLMKEELLLQ